MMFFLKNLLQIGDFPLPLLVCDLNYANIVGIIIAGLFFVTIMITCSAAIYIWMYMYTYYTYTHIHKHT